MGNSKRRYRKNSDRRIYVRGERHDPPDTYLLARALFDMAEEMAVVTQENQRTDQSDDSANDGTDQSEERI
ncbi:hypothetical protein [Nocardia wallacei]|uniref:Uncharacterized protein n=1 Tax=Nocardia wallacei TaxID=480035 RepID=A0A7G1KUJ4_9NOCA|nr:hypothetical protein [Nocardia wallacei]BCK57863.1 hypothetical protein NWFMUON74_56350 [Nocardia wallacei]